MYVCVSVCWGVLTFNPDAARAGEVCIAEVRGLGSCCVVGWGVRTFMCVINIVHVSSIHPTHT